MSKARVLASDTLVDFLGRLKSASRRSRVLRRIDRPVRRAIDLCQVSRPRLSAFLRRLGTTGTAGGELFRSPEVLSLSEGLDRLAALGKGISGADEARWQAWLSCIHQHRFDLLGSGWMQADLAVSPSSGARDNPGRVRAAMRELLDQAAMSGGALDRTVSNAVERYHPIDWHVDLRSGYRWPPPVWYQSDFGGGHGADEKTPGELSRFQHGAVLGIAHRLGLSTEAADRPHDLEWILQVLDWIASNPPRTTAAWRTALVAGIRAANWVLGLSLLNGSPLMTSGVRMLVAHSLFEHALHIQKNLNRNKEFTNNHYLGHILGLLFIYFAFPSFPDSDDWLLFCLHEVIDEMASTVYDDGGSAEASSHYHRFVLEMYLWAAALARRIPKGRRERMRASRAGQGRWGGFTLSRMPEVVASPDLLPHSFMERLHRMAVYTATITSPSGLVPVVGDADNGRFIKLSPVGTVDDHTGSFSEEFRDHRHVLACAGRLFGDGQLQSLGSLYAFDGVMLFPDSPGEAGSLAGNDEGGAVAPDAFLAGKTDWRLFPDSGRAVYRAGLFWLLITSGPTGRNGKGGHGHNDVLSFELHVRGVPTIVDPGSYVYTSDIEARNEFRSARNHNTLWLGDLEQHLMLPGRKGLFVLPERAHARILHADGRVFIGEHTGYGPRHRRRFEVEPDRIAVRDTLDGPARGSLSLIVGPGITVTSEAEQMTLERNGEPLLKITLTGLKGSMSSFWYAPQYGKRQTCLKIVFDREAIDTELILSVA